MERFDEYDCTSPHSHQHPDRVSDSLEDPISDEDVQPTRLSLACATTEKREKYNIMAGHDESAIWDEVQEEADELAHVHKDPHAHSVSLLSAGTSKRSKCENKLKFSIRGFNSILSGVKSENLYAGEQEVSSGMRPARAIETMVDEQVENIDEETEDLLSDLAHPTKNANISVAELLEDLQDRSASSVRTPFSIHQQNEAKEGKPKVSTSGKRILALIGQRDLDSEEPSEHAIGETSSEDEAEDTVRNNLTMVNKDVKGNRKTMSDLFQEAFNATDMEGTALPMRSTGAGYYGRMQQIMQMEKDRHAEFSRQHNKARDYLGDSKGVTVQILSRSLEGKLAVCLCLLKEKSNFPLTDCDMDGSSSKRTIIFSPKICDNVDLVEGNIIHIHPPWLVARMVDQFCSVEQRYLFYKRRRHELKLAKHEKYGESFYSHRPSQPIAKQHPCFRIFAVRNLHLGPIERNLIRCRKAARTTSHLGMQNLENSTEHLRVQSVAAVLSGE